MTIERNIRIFSGSFILLSLLLAHFHSRYWLWLAALVGVNLLQSAFTNFCPAGIILKKFGVRTQCCVGNGASGGPGQCC
jgi:hypothetical protein